MNVSNNTTDLPLCSPIKNHQLREFIIVGILCTVCVIVGAAANLTNIVIFGNRRMRKAPVNLFFIALSAADLFVLTCSMFMLALPAIAGYYESFQWITWTRTLVPWFYPLALVSQTCSVWLTVAMAVFRCIGITLPLHAQDYCTTHKAKITIGSVLFLCLAYNIPRFFEIQTHDCYFANFDVKTEDIVPTELREQKQYQLFYHAILSNLLLFAVPFAILILSSCKIIRAVQRSHMVTFTFGSKTDGKNGNGRQKSETLLKDNRRGAQSREKSTTLMLICVVIFFLVCNILGFVANIMELLMQLLPTFGELPNFTWTYYVLVDSGNLLAVVNSSMNIIIYIIFSTQYRLLLLRCCGREPLKYQPSLNNSDPRTKTRRGYIHSEEPMVSNRKDSSSAKLLITANEATI